MAYWICWFDDDEEMLDVRAERRPKHHAFLREHGDHVLLAGALFAEGDQVPSGALWVVSANSAEEVVAMIEQDPYFEPSIRKFKIFEWKFALPSYAPIRGEK